MESFEYIENYFRGKKLPGETAQFENRVASDPAFAEEVAFYLGAMQVAREQAVTDKKARFLELYRQSDEQGKIVEMRPVRRMWSYAAAAAAVVAGLLVGWFLLMKAPDHQKLADRYIQSNFQTLGVNMGSERDSLESGLRLYNSGRTEEALRVFEPLIQSGSADFNVIKYAGISCLRLGRFDEALQYFSKLESIAGLYANPGKFYKAVTLMKRNNPGDIELARQLLRQVVESDLEGKETASEWLKEL